MPSLADRPTDLERVFRVAALVLVAVALWRLVTAATAGAPVHHAQFEGNPAPLVRDSLAALARSGEDVSWSGSVSSLAAMAEAVREPDPAVRISVVSDSGAVVADDLGPLDSLASGGGTITIAGGLEGASDEERGSAFDVRAGATRAAVAAPPAPAAGRILLIGRATWESRFVIAALEEAGWLVDARVRLSDSLAVTQGVASQPALARHAVVVLLDSVRAADAAAITRFVNGGGGLVLAGSANRGSSLAALLAARSGALAPASPTFNEVEPLLSLPLHPLGALRTDAVLLESRDGERAVAARRAGGGRVVQAGYAETWRWRMQGGEGLLSVAAHRRWWSRLVALAVPTKVVARDLTRADEGAPLASLVQALGPQREAPRGGGSRGPAIPPWLGALVLALLLAEWSSRRLRGVA